MRGFLASVDVEILVAVQFVLQLVQHQFEHDRVIDETEHRHVVGHEIVGFGDIGQAVENPLPLGLRQRPFGILEHGHQATDPLDASRDEWRSRDGL